MINTLVDLHDCLAEGERAFLAGSPISSCPYQKMGERGERWIRGYSNARFGAALNARYHYPNSLPLETS